MELLKLESDDQQDIIQWDIRDSFQNLTIKEVLFLKFQYLYCGELTHVYKGDDDVFVNLIGLGRLIASQIKATDLFIGSVLDGSPRIADRVDALHYYTLTTFKVKT